MAAATACYKRILKTLEKWPIDPTKSGRDLGDFLKDSINKSYKSNQFEENIKYWEKEYLALERIVNNECGKKYPTRLTTGATGLTKEQCNIALSNDFLEELKEEDQTLVQRLLSSFRRKEN